MSTQRIVFKNVKVQRYLGDAPRTGTVELYVDWQSLVDALGEKAAYEGGITYPGHGVDVAAARAALAKAAA